MTFQWSSRSQGRAVHLVPLNRCTTLSIRRTSFSACVAPHWRGRCRVYAYQIHCSQVWAPCRQIQGLESNMLCPFISAFMFASISSEGVPRFSLFPIPMMDSTELITCGILPGSVSFTRARSAVSALQFWKRASIQDMMQLGQSMTVRHHNMSVNVREEVAKKRGKEVEVGKA